MIEYFAGLFDGEGCIHIRKSKRPSGIWGYQLSCVLGMVTPKPIHLLKKTFGGSIYIAKKKRPNRDCHNWTVCSRIALRFLEQVEPHLIVKKEEALLAMEFQAHVDAHSHRLGNGNRGGFVTRPHDFDQIMAYRDSLWLKMRELKN